MRTNQPALSDYVVKRLDAFERGCLVFLQPFNAASSFGVASSAAARAIVVNIQINGGVPGVYLLDAYIDRHETHDAHNFFFMAGDLEPFNLETPGLKWWRMLRWMQPACFNADRNASRSWESSGSQPMALVSRP